MSPDEIRTRERQAEGAPSREILVGEEPALFGDREYRRTGWDHLHRAGEIRPATLGLGRGFDLHLREAVARSVRNQHIRRVGVLVGSVDDIHGCRRHRTGHDRGIGQRAENSDRRVLGAIRFGLTREVGGQHCAQQRDVRDCTGERIGDDRGLDATRERPAVASVVPQLEPPGIAHGSREALGPRGVVEVGDGCRSELPSELARRAPQLRLLGRVPSVHLYGRARSAAGLRPPPGARLLHSSRT